MERKLLPFLLLLLVLVAGCSEQENKFTILGNIQGMPRQTILLEELGVGDFNKLIDSVTSDASGKFELSANAPEPGIYRLAFSEHQYILLSVDRGTLRINGNWAKLFNYTVQGSAPSESLRGFLGQLRQYSTDYLTISEVRKVMKMRGNDSLMKVAEAELKDRNQQITQFVERYADTTRYLPNAVFAAQILYQNNERTFLEAFTQSLTRRFPNSQLAGDFIRKVQAGNNTQASQENMAAPDFTLNTPDGKSVALSSLRGKYVLLDFWASWCGPCRAENPNVVKAYNGFKDKNFTVFSVSLDHDKDAWQKAIAADGLAWTHVSDLAGWESPVAQKYQVQSIPANFLIDPKGNIIASNLRGADLEAKLRELLK